MTMASSLLTRILSRQCAVKSRICLMHSAAKSKSVAFFDPRVQRELQFVNEVEFEKVFRVARRGQHIPPPTYQFLTDEELKEKQREAIALAEKKLQIPPVMEEREPIDTVLEHDPAIIGYDPDKIVFTDITFGVHDRDRIIVVREPDGRLREAEWEERDRMNQVYFPKEGRKIDMPAMFKPENLEAILRPDRYEYILDRNCVQWEPDHPIFIRTAERVYDHIEENEHYDSLKSTRHFGAMVFYLVWEKRCDKLIAHFLRKQDLERAVAVAKLFSLIHTDSVVAQADPPPKDIDLLRLYILKDSSMTTKLNASLESALEAIENAKKTSENLKKAHGSQTEET